MFDLHEMFGFEKNLADQGMKMFLGADPEEYIQLKKIPNPAYRSALNRELRASEAALASQDVNVQNQVSDEIFARVMAETCVIGWGKKFGLKGKVLPYSNESVVKIFSEYPEFSQKCKAWAESPCNYQRAVEVTPEQVKK